MGAGDVERKLVVDMKGLKSAKRKNPCGCVANIGYGEVGLSVDLQNIVTDIRNLIGR